jgi:hypothetical protein
MERELGSTPGSRVPSADLRLLFTWLKHPVIYRQ